MEFGFVKLTMDHKRSLFCNFSVAFIIVHLPHLSAIINIHQMPHVDSVEYPQFVIWHLLSAYHSPFTVNCGPNL